MSEILQAMRKRRSRLPAGPLGAQLVAKELARLGFDAQLVDRKTNDVLIRFDDMRLKCVQVRATHLSPWYVRCTSFAEAADQVTVYVLLGDKKEKPARFFLTRNSDVVDVLRQPSNWEKFGFIDIAAVERYENNWDILIVGAE